MPYSVPLPNSFSTSRLLPWLLVAELAALTVPWCLADRATYDKPHQYAVGVRHVLVNGKQVLKDDEHTGATPGRALWGPGKMPRGEGRP